MQRARLTDESPRAFIRATKISVAGGEVQIHVVAGVRQSLKDL